MPSPNTLKLRASYPRISIKIRPSNKPFISNKPLSRRDKIRLGIRKRLGPRKARIAASSTLGQNTK